MTRAPVYHGPAGRRDDGSWPGHPEGFVHPDLAGWLAATRLTPVSATEWRSPRDWSIPARRVPTACFCVYLGGRGWINVDGVEHAMEPGDLHLYPAGVLHGTRHDPRRPLLVRSGHFHARVHGGIDLLALAGFPKVVRGAAGPGSAIHTAATGLCREFARREAGWRTAMEAALWQLLLDVIRHHGADFTTVAGHGGERLLAAFSLADERLADPELAIGDLAAAVHLGEQRFRTLFRAATGLSPAHWLRRQRISEACRRLRQEDVAIDDLAHAVGFAWPGYFHRAFLAETGTTPAAWRAGRDG